jgi:hypothetical protein
MADLDIIELMRSPLTQSGKSSNFLRLVLSEAASYGMPAQVVATLDDIAAMLGYYRPLPEGQAVHLAGPLVQWRTDRQQPVLERITEIEGLALKQRALVAFGGAPPDHRVGTAEIIVALSNCHKSFMPKPYYEIWAWACTTVMAHLTGENPEKIRKTNEWPQVFDNDVLRPGGRLHPTYTEIATSIRRVSIDSMRGDEENPRVRLRPLALVFLHAHQRYLNEAKHEAGSVELLQVEAVENAIKSIHSMFPDITQDEINAVDFTEEVSKLAELSI